MVSSLFLISSFLISSENHYQRSVYKGYIQHKNEVRNFSFIAHDSELGVTLKKIEVKSKNYTLHRNGIDDSIHEKKITRRSGLIISVNKSKFNSLSFTYYPKDNLTKLSTTKITGSYIANLNQHLQCFTSQNSKETKICLTRINT